MVSAVAQGDNGSIGCRFGVERVVKPEPISHEVRDCAVIVFKVA